MDTITTKKNIKDLNVTIEGLYSDTVQINVHLSDKPHVYSLLLLDFRGVVDCKLSSFAANLWTRTNKGINYEKYSRIQDLQTAIKRLIKQKIDTNGEITFSLTDDICYL